MRHVPRAIELARAVEDWCDASATCITKAHLEYLPGQYSTDYVRYVNYLEQGAYGVHTWALFESGGQVGLIRLRVGESIGYNGVGKDIVECL